MPFPPISFKSIVKLFHASNSSFVAQIVRLSGCLYQENLHPIICCMLSKRDKWDNFYERCKQFGALPCMHFSVLGCSPSSHFSFSLSMAFMRSLVISKYRSLPFFVFSPTGGNSTTRAKLPYNLVLSGTYTWCLLWTKYITFWVFLVFTLNETLE